VIGFTGTDDKVKWLLNELKFDAAFNYKTTYIEKAIQQAAPEGVDCFFDNVIV
jgi:prostaglandin reductase 1